MTEIQIKSLDPQLYVQLTEKFFNRSYLNESKKITKVKSSLSTHSADVFCFQEPTTIFINELKNDNKFYVHEKGPDISMLLIRKQSFKTINDEKYLKSVLT